MKYKRKEKKRRKYRQKENGKQKNVVFGKVIKTN